MLWYFALSSHIVHYSAGRKEGTNNQRGKVPFICRTNSKGDISPAWHTLEQNLLQQPPPLPPAPPSVLNLENWKVWDFFMMGKWLIYLKFFRNL